jgi:gliding motility-associated-like protein
VKLVAYNFSLGCSDSTHKTVTVLDNCSAAVPNAFTPNGDGLNDYFWPHNALKADHLVFKVYDRWGEIVFTSTTWMDKWDGKFRGVPQPSGIYVWYLQYTDRDTHQSVFQKGTVMLIR